MPSTHWFAENHHLTSFELRRWDVGQDPDNPHGGPPPNVFRHKLYVDPEFNDFERTLIADAFQMCLSRMQNRELAERAFQNMSRQPQSTVPVDRSYVLRELNAIAGFDWVPVTEEKVVYTYIERMDLIGQVWGRASLDHRVDVASQLYLTFPDEHYLFKLNAHNMRDEPPYNLANIWAGVIVHEMLHNYGYRHGTLQFTDRDSFIYLYDKYIRWNGVEAAPDAMSLTGDPIMFDVDITDCGTTEA